MNETFEIIAELHAKKKTRNLGKRVSACFEGYENGTILAALVPILVELNLESCVEGDRVCQTCSVDGLTELLQAIRRVHEEIVDGMEEVE